MTSSSVVPNLTGVGAGYPAFNAILAFTQDLWETFGVPDTVTPLALYNRLISRIAKTDTNSILRVITGFEKFLRDQKMVMATWSGSTRTELPRNSRIEYPPMDSSRECRIYLEIGKFLLESDDDSKLAIETHLLTIDTILHPSTENRTRLKQNLEAVSSSDDTSRPSDAAASLSIDTSTNEGKFVANIINKAKDVVQDGDASNPMAAAMGLMSSGVLSEMMSGLQEGITSGDMDLRKLMGCMQGTISSLMKIPEEPKSPTVVTRTALPSIEAPKDKSE